MLKKKCREESRYGVGWGRSRGLVKEENGHQETGKDLLPLRERAVGGGTEAKS